VKEEIAFLEENGIGLPWVANALDNEAGTHANDMYSYMCLAVLPVVEHFDAAVLERQINFPTEPETQFRWFLAMQNEVRKYLALSIQARWEQRFRRWLRSYVWTQTLGNKEADALKTAKWDELSKILKRHRGISLEDLPDGPVLQDLTNVSNIIRHGDGPSVAKHFKAHPERWVNPAFGTPVPRMEVWKEDEVTDYLTVTDEDLRTYGAAASNFWKRIDNEYLLNALLKGWIQPEAIRLRAEGRS
jgi:hypothetical protein